MKKNLKKVIAAILALVVVFGASMPVSFAAESVFSDGLIVAAVDDPNVTEVTDIKISQASAVVYLGDTLQLSANVLPEDATNPNIVWTSNKNYVATVDRNGLVTPVSKGTALIIATSEDGGFNALCSVTVKAREYKVEWVVEGVVEVTQTYEEGAPIRLPSAPSKVGHVFTGWTPEVPSVMPSENLLFFATFEKIYVDPTVRLSILPASRYSVSYGDTLTLRCSVSGELPAGSKIVWEANTDLVTLDVAYGATNCTIIPVRHGSTPVRVMIVDDNDNVIVEDRVNIQSNATFFYKVIGSIKRVLGLTINYQ